MRKYLIYDDGMLIGDMELFPEEVIEMENSGFVVIKEGMV